MKFIIDSQLKNLLSSKERITKLSEKQQEKIINNNINNYNKIESLKTARNIMIEEANQIQLNITTIKNLNCDTSLLESNLIEINENISNINKQLLILNN